MACLQLHTLERSSFDSGLLATRSALAREGSKLRNDGPFSKTLVNVRFSRIMYYGAGRREWINVIGNCRFVLLTSIFLRTPLPCNSRIAPHNIAYSNEHRPGYHCRLPCRHYSLLLVPPPTASSHLRTPDHEDADFDSIHRLLSLLPCLRYDTIDQLLHKLRRGGWPVGLYVAALSLRLVRKLGHCFSYAANQNVVSMGFG